MDSRNLVHRSVADSLAVSLQLTREELCMLINISPHSLYQLQANDLLPAEPSMQIIHIQNAFKQAQKVFSDKQRALMWLKHENLALGNIRPIDLLGTPDGIDSVIRILGRIEHGVYS
ncbi:MAG: DUF2384 domain-containing protein [Desulfuromonadales bacterium]|nr:MAG: DUF2384 domain-containing protein [Desulfuromonadales bacterium]